MEFGVISESSFASDNAPTVTERTCFFCFRVRFRSLGTIKGVTIFPIFIGPASLYPNLRYHTLSFSFNGCSVMVLIPCEEQYNSTSFNIRGPNWSSGSLAQISKSSICCVANPPFSLLTSVLVFQIQNPTFECVAD